MMFYAGLHQPSDAKHFARAFVSINRLRTRQKPLACPNWILDSGAFRELEQFHEYRHSPDHYARHINRLARINPGLVAAVAQDYMCEPYILAKTGLTIEAHQLLTLGRYQTLRALVHRTYVMPVLQGYTIADYVRHLAMYEAEQLVPPFHYVGVGTLCKRNRDIGEITAILVAIKHRRPDLQLHGFGLKTTALYSGVVRDCLASADSMAWSFAARREGRDRNDWQEAARFAAGIEEMPVQYGWRF